MDDVKERRNQEIAVESSGTQVIDSTLNKQRELDDNTAATCSIDDDHNQNISTSYHETRDMQSVHNEQKSNLPRIKVHAENRNEIVQSPHSSEAKDLQNDHKQKTGPPHVNVASAATEVLGTINSDDHNERKIDSPDKQVASSAFEVLGLVNTNDQDETTKSSSSTRDLQDEQEVLQVVNSAADVLGIGETHTDSMHGSDIDTGTPIKSVKAAVSKYGGIVDWKAHRNQTVERRHHVELELQKLQEEIPGYRKEFEAAEQAKIQVLTELDSSKRLIEELKLTLERAQTEERQARQDAELAKLRVEELEQGIANESSVASKAQLEVAKARLAASISELTFVREELEGLRKEYASLDIDKDVAIKKAEESVFASKEVEKALEELTIEVISAKESFESAHSAHLEADEKRMGAIMARDEDSQNWEKELEQIEEEIHKLSLHISITKDLKSKIFIASAVLNNLKVEVAAYTEAKSKQENNIEGVSKIDPEELKRKTRTEIVAILVSARKELEKVKTNLDERTNEVNCLNEASASLKSELEQEKSTLETIRQREGMASTAVLSLEAELEKTKSEVAEIQIKEKETKEKLAEMPKKLQQAAEDADQANSFAQVAHEELLKVTDEADQAKATATTMESKLRATQEEIKAARTSEKLAIATIKALQESEATRKNLDVDSSNGVTLSLEEYYELSKRIHEAEEKANSRVVAVNSGVEMARNSEMKALERLAEVNQEMSAMREYLKVSMDRAEKATEGKLSVEQDLRKWRAELEQRRMAGESDQGEVNQNQSATVSSERTRGLNFLEGAPEKGSPLHYLSGSKPDVYENNTDNGSASEKKNSKKKKKPLFPRVLMFFARRKSRAAQ